MPRPESHLDRPQESPHSGRTPSSFHVERAVPYAILLLTCSVLTRFMDERMLL
jgi:hypothetical protein